MAFWRSPERSVTTTGHCLPEMCPRRPGQSRVGLVNAACSWPELRASPCESARVCYMESRRKAAGKTEAGGKAAAKKKAKGAAMTPEDLKKKLQTLQKKGTDKSGGKKASGRTRQRRCAPASICTLLGSSWAPPDLPPPPTPLELALSGVEVAPH
eukprot:15430328-Alexandrium_andersonii.AAC.1